MLDLGWVKPGVVLSPILVIVEGLSPLWGGFIPPFLWFYPPIRQGWGGVTFFWGGLAHLFVNQESQSRKTGCLMSICCAVRRMPWGGGGACPISISSMEVGEVKQGHGSTCDCTFSLLLHIAPCLLCSVICCFGGIKPPWGGFITPKEVLLTRGVVSTRGLVLTTGVVLFPKMGGCIPPKGWFIPQNSEHKTTWGGFKGGYIPHFGGVVCPAPSWSKQAVSIVESQA